MFQADTAPWLEFHAWNTDGSAKTDLAYNTTGLSLVVKRDNLADSSALSLSAASGPTDWASGKLWRMSGNKYRVGIATTYISSYTGKISVGGSYTGGDCSGITEICNGNAYAIGVETYIDVHTDILPKTTSLVSSFASLFEVLGAWTGTGVNTILGAFKALMSKSASAPSVIGGTFDPAEDSVESISDRLQGVLNVDETAVIAVPDSAVQAQLDEIQAAAEASSAWTAEDVEYALEKLALLGVVADAVVVPAGTFLCGRGDIEQIFGTTAVAKWGDLNNNEDVDEITSRINYRISIADSFMRSTLRNSAWVLPEEGDTIPPILAYYTACLAGVLLYEGRGVQDYDARGNAQHQLSFHKKSVEDFVKGVLFGSVSLAPLEYNVASAAPEAT